MQKATAVSDVPTASPPQPFPAVPATASGLQKQGHPAFGMPREFLGNRFVYAVISQRAHGLSIGVNMNPDQMCNFDCAYCEVRRGGLVQDRRVDLDIMATELETLLTLAYQHQLREQPCFRSVPEELLVLREVALSGDGEPTMSEQFSEIVREVVHIRSRAPFPFFKLVLITNSTGLDRPDVRAGLHALTSRDEIWTKLDAGTQDCMARVNRTSFRLEKVLANILLVGRERPIVIQSLFPLFEGTEPAHEEIEAYVHRLLELKNDGARISLVQVYSAHRPPHHPEYGHLPLKILSRIAQRVREVTGLKAEVF